MKSIILSLTVMLWTSIAWAQQESKLDSVVHQLAKEKDPQKTVVMIQKIIKDFKLDRTKDAETLDALYGTAAVNFAMKRNYPQYEKYIGLIRNKFNKTSYMNMAASKMLEENVDDAAASKIARQTLTVYQSFKDDPKARPRDFSKEDWKRFMDFAQYPYYDTYAQSLFKSGNYKEALLYQKKAFNSEPENGVPSSVERYAKLLTLTGNKDEAKKLLLKMAGRGRLNKGMTEQLQSIYISEKGSDEHLGAYLDSLQKNVQKTLVEDLKPKMINEKAPAFSLKDINGKEVALSDYTGRIVVLDLWATWCRPCIASFPAMQLMVQKHPEVAFLFIDVQEQDANPLPRVKSFIEKKNYPFTVLIDEPVQSSSEKYKIVSAYRPNGIPAKYIIDKNGILRFRTAGFDTDTELINELEAMFTIVKDL